MASQLQQLSELQARVGLYHTLRRQCEVPHPVWLLGNNLIQVSLPTAAGSGCTGAAAAAEGHTFWVVAVALFNTMCLASGGCQALLSTHPMHAIPLQCHRHQTYPPMPTLPLV